jgi:hypothetical protein
MKLSCRHRPRTKNMKPGSHVDQEKFTKEKTYRRETGTYRLGVAMN